MSKYVKIVVVLGVAAAVALAAGIVALADDPALPGDFGWFGRWPGAARIGDYFEQVREAVASKLGVTMDELAAARQEARQEVIEQAVADGEITQEQADRLLIGEHLEWPGRGSFDRRMGWGCADEDTQHAALAEALGMTVEELEAELAEGKTLRDLVDELGVDMDDVWDALQEARDAALQGAVEEGSLTQEQADWMLGHGAREAGHFGRARHPGMRPHFPTP